MEKPRSQKIILTHGAYVWLEGHPKPQVVVAKKKTEGVYCVREWDYKADGEPLPYLFPVPRILSVIDSQVVRDYDLVKQYDPNAAYERSNEGL